MASDRGRLLAVDYGERRIGLAISDPTGIIASPAGFILRRAGKRPPIAELVRRAVALEARGFVLGLPLDENGDDTPRATEVRAIAVELEKRSGLRVELGDERYTTAAARRVENTAPPPAPPRTPAHLHCTLTRRGRRSKMKSARSSPYGR